MSEKIILKAESRDIVGKKVKRLRRDGLTPAVIYGLNEPESIQLDTLTAFLTIRDAGDNDVIDLELDGKVRKVLTRDIQRHVWRGDLLHIDFLEVDMNVAVNAEATIVTVGELHPDIVNEGAVSQLLFAVEIEAKPDDLVSEIEIDLSKIKSLGDTLFVGDLNVPQGVTVLTEDDIAVAKFDVEREEELEPLEGEEGLLEGEAVEGEEGVEADGESADAGETAEDEG